jgi:hypothetical protein
VSGTPLDFNPTSVSVSRSFGEAIIHPFSQMSARAASLAPVNLGSAAGFVVLAKTGISTVPTSAITGNIGLSPASSTFITGFSLVLNPTNVFGE